MISSLTKNYYITSSMQKISSIQRFILETWQILESQDLKGHSHIRPCAYPKYFLAFLTSCMSMQQISSVHSSRVFTTPSDHIHPNIFRSTLNFRYQNVKKQAISSLCYFFFNWDSLHPRLNSHYKAWSYKKKKDKKIKAYRKSLQKEPTVINFQKVFHTGHSYSTPPVY